MEWIAPPLPGAALHRLTRAEYDEMTRLGCFRDKRFELLHGLLVDMSPRDVLHTFPIQKLNRLLRALGDRADVRVQMPLALSADSEPEPDLAVVALRDYLDEHPRTAFLVVEVANSSMVEDRLKARLYAEAGIPEYWVVDVQGRRVERYLAPAGGAYAQCTIHPRGDTLALDSFPDVVIPLAAILPP